MGESWLCNRRERNPAIIDNPPRAYNNNIYSNPSLFEQLDYFACNLPNLNIHTIQVTKLCYVFNFPLSPLQTMSLSTPTQSALAPLRNRENDYCSLNAFWTLARRSSCYSPLPPSTGSPLTDGLNCGPSPAGVNCDLSPSANSRIRLARAAISPSPSLSIPSSSKSESDEA